jgi:uncharacterized protein (TIGR02217 family)
MSTRVFPSLPGMILKSREPYFEVAVQKTLGGKEFRSTWWTQPRTRYTLVWDYLRGDANAEFQTLAGFFSRHLGQWDSFLFQDPEDYTVTSHYFGKGDGITTSFQLQRTLVQTADLPAPSSRAYWPANGDGYEPVFELNGTPTIVGGSGPSFPGQGIVTFSSAPGAGALLQWTGNYYKRCKFADQGLPMDRAFAQLWQTREIVIETVIP